MATRSFGKFAAVAGLAAALMVAAGPAAAAPQHHNTRADRGLYNYVPSGDNGYQSRNGTPFGPPDPASCGGYRC